MDAKPTRVVLIGAGHAHLRLIHHLRELRCAGATVTVIDPQENLFYSGMMPAVLGGLAAPRAARIPVRSMVEEAGGTFVRDEVVRVDPGARTVETTGARLPWDVASVAVGSRVAPSFPVSWSHGDLPTAKPVSRLPELADRVRRLQAAGVSPRVVVVGGGPSGVEIAGNLVRAAGGIAGAPPTVTVVTRSDRLLAAMPAAAGEHAASSLTRRGVRVLTGRTVTAVRDGIVEFGDGETIPADIPVVATGLRPPEFIRSSGVPTDETGALLVDGTLSVAGQPLFGGGDCISVVGMDLARIGVHAVRENGVLLHNVRAAVVGEAPGSFVRYDPPAEPLLIVNPGDGTGIAVRGTRVSVGRRWLALKLRIDWAFVRSRGRRIMPGFMPPPRRSRSGR